MAAGVKNFVYEINASDSKRVIEQQAASKAFLQDCKKAAQKYQKK